MSQPDIQYRTWLIHLSSSQLLFNSRVIPIKAKNEPVGPIIRSANAQGLQTFSAFLPTLPGLAKCLTAANDSDIPWPSFTGDSAKSRIMTSRETGKAKQREREICLLNGVVEGLEVICLSGQRVCRVSIADITLVAIFVGKGLAVPPIPLEHITARGSKLFVPHTRRSSRQSVYHYSHWHTSNSNSIRCSANRAGRLGGSGHDKLGFGVGRKELERYWNYVSRERDQRVMHRSWWGGFRFGGLA